MAMKKGKYIRTLEIKEKNRIASTGKRHSIKTKKKMSESQKGHPAWNKGKKHSKESIEKMKTNQPKKFDSDNCQWKDNKVGYNSLHSYVKRRKKKPKLCECCNKKPPFDLANKGIYNRELKNWEWLCRKCHMIKDGRLNKLNKKSI